MPNRREFLKAGIGVTGCGLLGSAQQLSGLAPRRRQVVVSGRRVKTVDVHAHCAVPEATELMGRQTSPQDPLVLLPERLRHMDEQGIDMEALSINPNWYALERDMARQVIKIQNEKLAELCAANPERVVAFASVALQHPDLAAEQLEEGVKKLGLRGAAIGGHVNGEELSSPRLDPFWAKAAELGVLVFMHPGGADNIIREGAGRGRGDLC